MRRMTRGKYKGKEEDGGGLVEGEEEVEGIECGGVQVNMYICELIYVSVSAGGYYASILSVMHSL